jgi:TROVE domain
MKGGHHGYQLRKSNLGKMTAIDLIKPFSDAKKVVLRKLKDETALKRSRIHPLAVLVAQKIYAQGHGDKGALEWSPVSAIVDGTGRSVLCDVQQRGTVQQAGAARARREWFDGRLDDRGFVHQGA